MVVLGRRLALTCVVLSLACACSTLPRQRPESPALPVAWTDAPVGAEVDLSDWWRGFNDPVLTALVEQALASGPSVQLAVSRVAEARAQSRGAISAYLPELSATARGNYTNALEGAGNEQMTGAYGAQVSWEIPLFARIEATSVGARASTAIAEADLRGARVALAADLAQAYVDLRAAQNSRAALSQSVTVADQLAGILEISARAGLTAAADAADARRLAEATRARLPSVTIEARRAENVLAVLRGLAPGTEPEALRGALAAESGVPSLALKQAPAAPADLLRLRPDVARAEAQALLAAAQVADARANLLPRLNLSGSILVSESLLGAPVVAAGAQAQATPLISIPLFDWGSRINQVRARDAQFEQALIRYRQTVTQAVAEASNALTALEQGRLRLVAARAAEAAATASTQGSRASYQAGIQSLTDRLRNEQQLIDATLSRVAAEADRARAAIATYRAFGGGPNLAPRD